MEWVLNNLDNVIIPIIIAVLYMLGSAAQKKGKGEKPDQPGSQQKVDPGDAKRISEIQEEIRRKIAERSGRTPPPPAPQTQPAPTPRVAPPPLQKAPPAYEDRRPAPPERTKPTLQPASIPRSTGPSFQKEAYQRDIEAKMKKARDLEARLKIQPIEEVWGAGTTRDVPRTKLQKELFRDLSNPIGQRKAILVSEILGTPVGIKGPSGWKSNV